MGKKLRFPSILVIVLIAFLLSAGGSVTIPTPATPSGTIGDKTPTYKWTKIVRATSYRYQLMKGTKVIYTKTVLSKACGAKFCSNTPTTPLSFGAYKWRVAAYIGGAWKAYSKFKTFALVAPSIKVLNSNIFVTSDGERFIFGEVYNATPYSLWGVQIAVNFFNNGQLVATGATNLELDPQPYEKTCLWIISDVFAADWTTYSFGPVTYSKTSATRPSLTITDSSSRVTENFYEISGHIRNDDSHTAHLVHAVATLYNAAGEVIGCDSEYTYYDYLYPGEIDDFYIYFDYLAGQYDVATYSLQADGYQ
jgi:hypothetical protein